MISLWRRIYRRKTKRVGVLSLAQGCGTTHLSIAIANYYASKERKSVLYLECARDREVGEGTPRDGIITLRSARTVDRKGICGFERDGVCYLPQITQEDVRRLLAEKDDVILAEVPEWTGDSCLRRGIFDQSILMLSAKPWKYPAVKERMKHIAALDNGIAQGDCVCFGLTKAEDRMLAADFNVHCEEIPMIRDPFCLSKEDIRFLKRLLE